MPVALPKRSAPPQSPEGVPASAHTANSPAPLFEQLLQAGFDLLQHLAGLDGGLLEGLKPIGSERREDAVGVIIQHGQLFGFLGRGRDQVLLDLFAHLSDGCRCKRLRIAVLTALSASTANSSLSCASLIVPSTFTPKATTGASRVFITAVSDEVAFSAARTLPVSASRTR